MRYSMFAMVIAGLLASGIPVSGALWTQQQENSPNPPAPRPEMHGHAFASPTLHAMIRSTPVTLDGRLDEDVWKQAGPATSFRQSQPTDGAPATQPTEVRILYDADYLYVGARMYDSLGAAGVRSRLVRRDQWTESDWIELIFDTYHDHVGRTSFATNPAGVRRDQGVASSSLDASWDPVWSVATAVDSLGWSAEFKIPFGQLRFRSGADQVWGLQIWRTVSRLNEVSMWSYWSTKETGGPQRFGHVEDLKITGTPKRLEVLPYVVERSLTNTPTTGDPFHDGSSLTTRVGADIKYLVTSNLQLNATINPDFGQAEVDPAVVNLSAFETFFPEKRQFFIEGGGAFGFGGFNCYFCSNVSSVSLLFTRRIGRPPQGGVPAGTEFDDRPEAATILGAAKLSGRLPSGMTIGLMDAVTARETARTFGGGAFGSERVEPLTNYFVGRVKQDLKKGDIQLGGILTSVTRQLGNESLLRDRMASHAEAMGLDWRATWKSRTYSLMGNVAMSNVVGSPEMILGLQRGSARYFQRPDRQSGGNDLFSDALDPTATHLRGFSGYTRLAKDSGNWLWESQVNIRSPGFESNDLGFNTRSDFIWMGGNVVRNIPTQGSWYRWLWIDVGAQQQYNFDGDLTDRQFQGNFSGQFLNYWNFGTFGILRPAVLDDRATRGGPVVGRPASGFVNAFVGTDSRKALSLELSTDYGWNTQGGFSNEVSLFAAMQPASNIRLTVGPSWNKDHSVAQFVTSVDDPTRVDFFGRRYVFSDTRQTTLSMNTRLNVTFTPNLTLELFAQPFISSVHFSRFKEFTTPRKAGKTVYGKNAGTITPVLNASGQTAAYTVDPDDAGPAASFQFDNPDFVFRSLRGNAVLRWEYRPGSTIFLVWTQSRSQFDPFVGDFSVRAANGSVFGRQPENVLLLKMNYWLNL